MDPQYIHVKAVVGSQTIETSNLLSIGMAEMVSSKAVKRPKDTLRKPRKDDRTVSQIFPRLFRFRVLFSSGWKVIRSGFSEPSHSRKTPIGPITLSFSLGP